MAEEEKKKEEKKEVNKTEEKPNPNLKPPQFKKLTEGVITSKDKENLDDLLNKIFEDK